MGQIYSKAFVTIISAAGEDENYGLPGCGTVSRSSQHQATLKGLTIIHIPSLKATGLGATKWASRGWTYQECILSRRRLIFTHEQVIYVCDKSYAPECMNFPPNQKLYRPSDIKYMIYNPHRNGVDGLTKMISEYTRRQLSYEEDSLNAFVGILERYKTDGIHHIWGLPIDTYGDGSLALTWIHPNATSTRRAAFPSWSWTGWAGPVECNIRHGHGKDYQIFVRLPSGTLESFSDFRNFDELETAHRHGGAQELEFIGLVFTMSFKPMRTGDSDYYFWERYHLPQKGNFPECMRGEASAPGVVAFFEITPDRSVGIRPHFDTKFEPGDRLHGLVLGYLGDDMNFRRNILIVKEMGGYFERVGVILLDFVICQVHQNFVKEPLWVQKAGLKYIHLK